MNRSENSRVRLLGGPEKIAVRETSAANPGQLIPAAASDKRNRFLLLGRRNPFETRGTTCGGRPLEARPRGGSKKISDAQELADTPKDSPGSGKQVAVSWVAERPTLVTAANVANSTTASVGEFQEKLTNEGPRNRREAKARPITLPGEKKRNLEIVSKVLKKKPPVTLEAAAKKIAATVREKKAIEAKMQKGTAKIHVITLPGV
ncbi:ribosome biogenesis regulatory protein [Culex quinquefasciatus]|uniref:Ribosome biogenesis regulatory protein n=1 Tax=Culex quinquefasciatus TaxID=7176 RepID=B0WQT3_CULQU|nr:ribosome biogenesis regulatory protein [Culex quinquefasciatus]|eukprot:XP_001851067.1 ribosome biogenesis regulatory protein [Culex quinquefasciatus]